MEFCVLGPLEVRDDGRPLALGGTRKRALLATLLLNANRPISIERLVDALWGERPPPTAAATVRRADGSKPVVGSSRKISSGLRSRRSRSTISRGSQTLA